MKPFPFKQRTYIKGGIPIKYVLVLLLTVTLTACTQENTEENLLNEGPPPFSDEEIELYVDEHQFEIPAILNTSDKDYAAILGNNELHQLYKDENDETVTQVHKLGNKEVEFGALNAIIYVVIKDKELLEAGDRLVIEHDNGAFSSELVLIDENSYFTLFDSDSRVEGSVDDARLIIYDSQENSIYEQDLEN